jgi:hypothetical protein
MIDRLEQSAYIVLTRVSCGLLFRPALEAHHGRGGDDDAGERQADARHHRPASVMQRWIETRDHYIQGAHGPREDFINSRDSKPNHD